jgi:hypothetical protein
MIVPSAITKWSSIKSMGIPQYIMHNATIIFLAKCSNTIPFWHKECIMILNKICNCGWKKSFFILLPIGDSCLGKGERNMGRYEKKGMCSRIGMVAKLFFCTKLSKKKINFLVSNQNMCKLLEILLQAYFTKYIRRQVKICRVATQKFQKKNYF